MSITALTKQISDFNNSTLMSAASAIRENDPNVGIIGSPSIIQGTASSAAMQNPNIPESTKMPATSSLSSPVASVSGVDSGNRISEELKRMEVNQEQELGDISHDIRNDTEVVSSSIDGVKEEIKHLGKKFGDMVDALFVMSGLSEETVEQLKQENELLEMILQQGLAGGGTAGIMPGGDIMGGGNGKGGGKPGEGGERTGGKTPGEAVPKGKYERIFERIGGRGVTRGMGRGAAGAVLAIGAAVLGQKIFESEQESEEDEGIKSAPAERRMLEDQIYERTGKPLMEPVTEQELEEQKGINLESAARARREYPDREDRPGQARPEQPRSEAPAQDYSSVPVPEGTTLQKLSGGYRQHQNLAGVPSKGTYTREEAETIQKLRKSGQKSQAGDLSKYSEEIAGQAKKYGIEPETMLKMAGIESQGDQNAVSPTGALGLFQIVGSTATHLGITNRFDPHQNIEGAVKYAAENKQILENENKKRESQGKKPIPITAENLYMMHQLGSGGGKETILAAMEGKSVGELSAQTQSAMEQNIGRGSQTAAEHIAKNKAVMEQKYQKLVEKTKAKEPAPQSKPETAVAEEKKIEPIPQADRPETAVAEEKKLEPVKTQEEKPVVAEEKKIEPIPQADRPEKPPTLSVSEEEVKNLQPKLQEAPPEKPPVSSTLEREAVEEKQQAQQPVVIQSPPAPQTQAQAPATVPVPAPGSMQTPFNAKDTQARNDESVYMKILYGNYHPAAVPVA